MLARRRPATLIALAMTAAFASISHADDEPAESGDDSAYELRVYTCEPGRLDKLHARFREHTMDLFAKHGMTNVAYFTPQDEPRSADTLVYFLKHDSRQSAAASFAAFRADPQWIEVRTASEADGKILSAPVSSTFLTLTDYSAQPGPANPELVYELRTYTAAEGKLADLETRFRDHTLKLFEKHRMKNVAYWKPQDPPGSQTTLVYLLEHASRDAAKASWDGFLADPQWQAAAEASEVNGPLVDKIESQYLVPTPYSPKPAEAN